MSARHLYVHVPFCARRCSYCDFAIAVRRDVPTESYLDALAREIAIRFPERTGQIDTFYLGGGTPSRLGATGIANLVGLIRSSWPLAKAAEVTIEANPEDVTPESVRGWLDAGVNRVSLGIQSFDDRVLAWMHRVHDAAAAKRAAQVLRQEGVGNWSLDLIYALPASLDRDWKRDVMSALALEPPHISCYGLTIESHTPLAHWRSRGELHEASDDRFASEFLLAHDAFTSAGYAHYEVSNYARPSFEARHNSAYWNRSPYIGLGPSAHSFDGAVRRWNEREYAAWAARLERGEDPLAGDERLGDDQVAIEETYLGLRSTLGVRLRRADRRIADDLVRRDWARIQGDRLRLTAEGWLRLDTLAAALTESRSHS